MSKTRILAFIIFIAAALISYFATQPVTQNARAAVGKPAIRGNIYYDGAACEHRTGDHVKVYRWTESGVQFVMNANVTVGANWNYVITDADLDSTAAYYRLIPQLYAAGQVSPQVRDSVWWELEMEVANQSFTTVVCNQAAPPR